MTAATAPVAKKDDAPAFDPGAPPPATLFQDVWRGIGKENPVLVQFLGMCPTMAVTNILANGFAMGVATTFVLVGSGLFVSLFRKYVALADMLLAASFPDISKALGPFIPLIVANCLLLGRAEAFAAKVGPVRAVADGLGMGLGFTVSLSALASFREILGRGTILGHPLFGPRFEPWVFLMMPPGGFFTLGVACLVVAYVIEWRKQHAPREA